jgi:hypothetical protein
VLLFSYALKCLKGVLPHQRWASTGQDCLQNLLGAYRIKDGLPQVKIASNIFWELTASKMGFHRSRLPATSSGSFAKLLDIEGALQTSLQAF